MYVLLLLLVDSHGIPNINISVIGVVKKEAIEPMVPSDNVEVITSTVLWLSFTVIM